MRRDAGLDGGTECTMEVLGGALCDDEPCIAPAREISCPGGIQNLSVAAVDDGTTWFAASVPPRLVQRVGEELEEHPLAIVGDGNATLVVGSSSDLWVLYADRTFAVARALEGPSLRTTLADDSAYWVVVGAAIDASDTLHVAWIDEAPALHAGTAPLDDATAIVTREVSPTYFADTAMTLGPDGVPHVAYWRHRSPTSAGRDLYLRDGEAGVEHAITFVAEPNDDGTNVSIAASATALLASLDFADGIHVLVPDDTVPETGYRDQIMPGSGPLVVTGCPELPPPGMFCDELCTESGTGTVRRAQETVVLEDGRFALLWVERSVSREVQQSVLCGGAGCSCVAAVLSESSTTTLVFGLVDELTGMPARTLVVPLGDVEIASGLSVSRSGERIVVGAQTPELTAVLVEIDLSLLF